jgi:nitrous oxidase accessory protein NosD
VDGAIWVQPRAHGASVSKLRLTASDPVYEIPLKVLADDVRVTRNWITGSASTICVLVGSHRVARRTRIERNRISRCGSTGKFDHLIYLEQTRQAIVRNNVLTSNAGGWAVHMYPDADGTVVERNTIDGNQGGVIFAGDGAGATSDGNVVRFNVITFSNPRWNIEGSWSGGPVGRGNRAHDNCLFTEGPSAPGGIGELDGFTADRNVAVAASPYIGRPLGDYRLAPSSGCPVLPAAR